MPKTRKVATCHPDRRHKAKGLCVPCYRRFKWRSPKYQDSEDTYYREEYGMSKTEADAFRAKFPNCAICSRPSQHIDHSQDTGKVRGMLCIRCNFLVGTIESYQHWLPKIFKYVADNE